MILQLTDEVADEIVKQSLTETLSALHEEIRRLDKKNPRSYLDNADLTFNKKYYENISQTYYYYFGTEFKPTTKKKKQK